MTPKTSDRILVRALMDGDLVTASAAFQQALMPRIQNALEQRRLEIAPTLLKPKAE